MLEVACVVDSYCYFVCPLDIDLARHDGTGRNAEIQFIKVKPERQPGRVEKGTSLSDNRSFTQM